MHSSLPSPCLIGHPVGIGGLQPDAGHRFTADNIYPGGVVQLSLHQAAKWTYTLAQKWRWMRNRKLSNGQGQGQIMQSDFPIILFSPDLRLGIDGRADAGRHAGDAVPVLLTGNGGRRRIQGGRTVSSSW